MKLDVEVIDMQHNMRLANVKHEWNARKKAYIVASRDNSTILLGQRLQAIAAHINAHLVHTPYDRVSTSGMYDITNRDTARVGPYHKRMWKVEAVPIDIAATRFEAERASYQRAAVLGHADCYTLECA